MDGVHDLLRSPIFDGLSSDDLEVLCSHSRVLSFEAGHPLFERGQKAEELMILREGVVELFFPIHILGATREVTLESKQAGDVVAWSALISPYRFTVSARCAGKCVVTGLSRDALHGYFETEPKVGYLFMRNLAGVIGERLQALHTIWVHDLQSSVIRRLE